MESTIAGIEDKLGLAVAENQKRFFAIKLLERDSKISEVLKSTPNVDAEIKALEDKYDDDTESIITNERYQYISSIIGSCVKKARAGKETVSDKIDRIVTNRFLALPIFALIMWAVYYVAVSSLGGIVTDWTNDTLFGAWIQPAVQTFMENVGCSDWLVSLVVDGIIGGLGAPIGFAPQMAIVFLFLSILEDCGYMARVAFIMDRIFRRFGLSGKSFIPFLIGSGCGVPGIMATRTIENEKDRRMTMMTVTNIPCGAKLPVIALVAGAITSYVLCRNRPHNHLLYHFKENKSICRRACTVCNGAPTVSYPFSKGCAVTCMGESMGIPQEGRNNPLPLLCSYVVPFKLRHSGWRIRTC